jgi:hypothetical protein
MPRNFTHFCRVRFIFSMQGLLWDSPEDDHIWMLVWDQLEEVEAEEL